MSAKQNLQQVLDETFQGLEQNRLSFKANLTLEEVGRVSQLGQGVARVSGLQGVRSEELLRFASGGYGLAFDLTEDDIGVILLDAAQTGAGDLVQRTKRVLDIEVTEQVLGRIIDALGRPLDEAGPIEGKRLPIEQAAPEIIQRAPVTEPLQTGIKIIDALVPIGKGQRELILGDRQTGKTSLVVDTIINQKQTGVICIYCAIGQRRAAVAKVISDLQEHGAMDYTVVLLANGEDPPGLIYIAPYAATSIAEFFMHLGRDVLIIYDDLTQHARAYRELSLLLRRPPGREAFPGDIFYLHSRLLERATHLNEAMGGGSLTAIPIIETEAQNLSAYIPTNLISITDGQLYLSPQLFYKGVLPAIDIGLSVSRVGGKAQRRAYRELAGPLRLAYAQFEELEAFARFGTRLDETTQQTLTRGRCIREILKQAPYNPLKVSEQITLLLAVNEGLFDDLPYAMLTQLEGEIRRRLKEEKLEAEEHIEQNQSLTVSDKEALLGLVKGVIAARHQGEGHG
ncbi:MAG: alternate F1F0 ATPase, F1 subunit alpha [Trueperaceae bacterium]|nr:alternate F1F0 ATPase, F1 subunit alpha [Trueperaceae bacterium]